MTEEPTAPTPVADDGNDNETMREVKEAKRHEDAAQPARPGWKTAAGIGIGSAAVAAALIYVSRGRRKGG